MSNIDTALSAIRAARRDGGGDAVRAHLLRAEAELLLARAAGAESAGGVVSAQSGTGLPPRPPER